MSSAGAGRQLGRRNQVFLNVPYDSAYANVFVALVAAVVAAGRFPRCTLEVPSLTDRRDRIFKLIESCGASIHDITIRDRLNMPFELGFAFAVQRHRPGGAHSILVLNENRLP